MQPSENMSVRGFEFFALPLLRAHVERTAEDLAGSGQIVGTGVLIDQFGYTEVNNLDKVLFAFPIDDHDVARFYIAMNNPFGMGVGRSHGRSG